LRELKCQKANRRKSQKEGKKMENRNRKQRLEETARTADLTEAVAKEKELKERNISNATEFAAQELATEIWEEENHEKAPNEDKPTEWYALKTSLQNLLEVTSEKTETESGTFYEMEMLGSCIKDHDQAEEFTLDILQALRNLKKADQKISEFYEETKEAKSILEERIKQALEQEQSTPTEWARSHELSEEENE